MIRRIAVMALILSFALSFTGASARKKLRVSGIYSDLHYNEEAGDLLGTEVWLTPTNSGWHAVVQIAEGEPDVPVVVFAEVDGANVSFEIPGGDRPLRFIGRVSDRSLDGTLGHETLSLKRGRSYWQ
jgi:hypothetical protein